MLFGKPFRELFQSDNNLDLYLKKLPAASADKPESIRLARDGKTLKATATPFDMEGERKRPTWGDPSWRRIAADADRAGIEANHLHIDTGYVERDLNVALPIDRLRELAAAGEIGSVAPTHYSTMGFQGNDTSVLTNESAPAIAAAMKSEEVDLALLAPV